jgi:hypothetical protein
VYPPFPYLFQDLGNPKATLIAGTLTLWWCLNENLEYVIRLEEAQNP